MAFEIFVLYIVNELYFRQLPTDGVLEAARARLRQKIALIQQMPEQTNGTPLNLVDFGLRRRYSGAWHEEVVRTLAKALPENFRGTSNVHFARRFDLLPIGTMAHEYLQAYQAFGFRLRDFQKAALEGWVQEYRGDLGIALTDVVGMDAFLHDFDLYFAKLFDGLRHDSGDPIEWGEKAIAHYQALRIDPRSKRLVFSDGLNVPRAIALHRHFLGRIPVAFGIGKQLLPTYNIFDERRHFEPGPDVARVLRIGDSQVGFLICEDGWNDAGQDYAVNPFARLADAAPDLVILINASPSNIGKREQRHALFAAASRRHQLPIVYVNQVGGHDQLVFDGASFAVTPHQGVVFEASRFVEAVSSLRWSGTAFTTLCGAPLEALTGDGLPVMEFYRRQIVLGLSDYARRCGFRQAVIGCSGGIDSALTLALAVEALGAENVVAITMPSRFSSAGSVSDSRTLCRYLGITLHEHPIQSIVSQYEHGFLAAFGTPLRGLALENLQARVRGTLLMEFSNAYGHLLLTTGNKSEISVGYCTLYGDTNGGLGLIGDLYKTEVFALCRHLNDTAGREFIPLSIIDKPPSAELAPAQLDTDSLPPYPILDSILKKLIEGDRLGTSERESVERQFAALAADEQGRALIERIRHMINRNEYKRRQAPPILRLRARAFGSGRQMPIAANYLWTKSSP